VDRLGQDLGQRGLAGSPRAREQVGMGDPVQLDGVSPRADDVLLADTPVEVLRAMCAVERGHEWWVCRATVHPPSRRRTRTVSVTQAPSRLTRGTRLTLLSAASFRT